MRRLRLRGDRGCVLDRRRSRLHGWSRYRERLPCGGRLCCQRLLGRARLFVARRWRSNRSSRRDRRLNNDRNGRGRDNNDRPCCRDSTHRRLGDDRTRRWSRCNRWRSRRRNHDVRRGPRLRHNFAWLRTRRCCRRGSRDSSRGRRGTSRRNHRRGLCAYRCVASARVLFFLLLAGQNCLQRVAGLGDMGEIHLGLEPLRRARGRGARVAAWFRSTQLRANLLRLVIFQGTGMGLAASQAELRQHIKNLPTLDFHLACQIVDSNLTHPPLFKMC